MKEIDNSQNLSRKNVDSVSDQLHKSKKVKASLDKQTISEMKILEKAVNIAGGKFKRFEPDYSPAKPLPKTKIVKQKKREFFRIPRRG